VYPRRYRAGGRGFSDDEQQHLCIRQGYGSDSLDEDSYEKLEKIVSDVPDYCTLIFYIGKADSLKKTAKAKKAVSLFTKHGNAIELNKKTAYELAKMLVGAAQKRDSSLSQRNAEYLVSCVGDDMVTLLNEIDKLSAYAEGREIHERTST